MTRRVGALAVQGDFQEHMTVLKSLGVDAIPIRLPHELQTVDALIIPGGESTTIARLMETFELKEPVQEFARAGNPVWGTCAGMIVAATDVPDLDRESLGLIDIRVRRNAFGRQVDSFETAIDLEGLDGGPFHAIFIRAPIIEEARSGVEILARLQDGTPVAARQGNILVTAFHPELTKDGRVHQLFLDIPHKRGD